MHSEAKQYWNASVWVEKGLCRAMQQAWLTCAHKAPELSHGFQKSVYKDQVKEGCPRVCDWLLCNSLIGWWWGNWPLTLSILQFSRSVTSDSLRPYGLQHARLPCPSPTPGAYSNSCPLSWWCHPTISSSVVPFSSRLQYFPASGSFPMSALCIRWPKYGATVSATVLPMNIQDWFPLGLTGLISLQSKGLSRVFSRAKFQKHQFFSAYPSSWSNSHNCTWLLEKTEFWLDGP